MNNIAKSLPDNFKGKSFILRGTTPLKKRYCGNANIFNEEEKIKVFNRYNTKKMI